MSREPFQPLSIDSINQSSPSTPSSSRSTPPSKPLAPIFTRTYSRPRPSSNAGPSSSPLASKSENVDEIDNRVAKRARIDSPASASLENDENVFTTSHKRNAHSIQEWFITTPLRGELYAPDLKDKGKQKEEPVLAHGEWKRRRGRGPFGRTSIMTSYRPRECSYPRSTDTVHILTTSKSRSLPVSRHLGHPTELRSRRAPFSSFRTLDTPMGRSQRLCSASDSVILSLCQAIRCELCQSAVSPATCSSCSRRGRSARRRCR